MGYHSLLIRSPKKEEQEVPDGSTASEFDDTKGSYAHGEIDIIHELDGILGDENGDLSGDKMDGHGHLSWDFMDWETGFRHADDEEGEEDEGDHKVYCAQYFEEECEYNQAVKTEQFGFWELDDEKRVSLNLNLNYQDVLDAWSDRGPLWADDCSISTHTNGYYVSIPPSPLLILVSVNYQNPCLPSLHRHHFNLAREKQRILHSGLE
ncbi:hypothetical protein V6N13_010997 [Hibiscus sabdariffa]|uniref:Uncharacterized protein n=1 Tax=Hibiscus sabdariffa TaxID=183260 RepID=A0ABR2SBL3_9ROSI